MNEQFVILDIKRGNFTPLIRFCDTQYSQDADEKNRCLKNSYRVLFNFFYFTWSESAKISIDIPTGTAKAWSEISVDIPRNNVGILIESVDKMNLNHETKKNIMCRAFSELLDFFIVNPCVQICPYKIIVETPEEYKNEYVSELVLDGYVRGQSLIDAELSNNNCVLLIEGENRFASFKTFSEAYKWAERDKSNIGRIDILEYPPWLYANVCYLIKFLLGVRIWNIFK
jgi:hypothetical protein